MKIDIHVHTKKTKQGDASTRAIEPKRFMEIVSGTDVKIFAITNHNVFDLAQYNAIVQETGKDIQVWPGIELDVVADERRGHLLVIVDPKHAPTFSAVIEALTIGSTADTFTAPIADVLQKFDLFGPLYIAHHSKKPDLLDESIDELISKTKHPSRVIREVTNSISAGIYINHGYRSIYGSDIHDWSKYQAIANDLPELRLPVGSFEHFCLLLEKDSGTINTILDQKMPETLRLRPFKDGTILDLKVYNDINIIFGSKGTGKSDILKAIAKHYRDKGINADIFATASEKLDDVYNTKGKGFVPNLNPYGIDYCGDEISFLKKAQDKDVVSPSAYVKYFLLEAKNKNRAKIKVKDLGLSDIRPFEKEFLSIGSTYNKVLNFIELTKVDKNLKTFVTPETMNSLEKSLQAASRDLAKAYENSFAELKTHFLFNHLVNSFNAGIAKKAGLPTKPSTIGFQAYAVNRIEIEKNAAKILLNLKKPIKAQEESVGSLGLKGDLICKTELIFHDGRTNGKFSTIADVQKTLQKNFVAKLAAIHQHAYDSKLFEDVAELTSEESIDSIKTIFELLLFRKHFMLAGDTYTPSTGEASMVLLHQELSVDKDVYILDEPERSLGNDYINDVIVPLIKDKAREGKKVFVATHDANIAVRTLPYNSIYRLHRPTGYDTFVGNPFSNHLVNILVPSETIDWKETSMKTLEGGKAAFGERSKIYGHS